MEQTSGVTVAVDGSNDGGSGPPGSESSIGRFSARAVWWQSSSSSSEGSPSASLLEQRDTGVAEGRRTLRRRLVSIVASTLRFLNPIAALRRAASREATPEAAEPARAWHRPGPPPALREVPGFLSPGSPRPPAAGDGAPGPEEASLLSAFSSDSTTSSEHSARSAFQLSQAGSTPPATALSQGPSGPPFDPVLARRADVQAERVLQLLEIARERPLNDGEARQFQRLTKLDNHHLPPDLLREFRGAVATARSFDANLERATELLARAEAEELSHAQRLELNELQRTMKAEVGPTMLRCYDWHERSVQRDRPSPAGELLSRFFRMRFLDRGLVLVNEIMPRSRQIASAEPVAEGAAQGRGETAGPVAVPRDPGIAGPPLSGPVRADAGAALSVGPTVTGIAPANGIDLAYSDTGGNGPAIVLIRGLGTQMTEWSPALIDGLRQQGLRVIAFDNRDCGLSGKLDDNYPLSAMADDVAGLLDFLSVDRAHIFGISLGGMVAQLVAHQYPDRVLSLFSVMSSSGNPDLPPMADDVKEALLRQARGREEIVRLDAANRKLFGSPYYPESVQARLAAARAAYDRCYCPDGVGRQLTAAMSDGSRVDRLKTIDAPTLVIHGEYDRLFSPACGEDTAKCIADAELAIVAGMGHNIPDMLAPHIVELVGEFIGRRAPVTPHR